jgi:hypothetical protein
MPPVDTNTIIRDAREELKTRVLQREQTDKRIAELRILLRSLVRFMPEDTHRQAVLAEIENAKRKAPSLTDAVSEVLMRSNRGVTGSAITSTEIREALEQAGFDLDEYSQPLGAIMTVLKRLSDGDNARVKRELRRDKSVAFRWVGERIGKLSEMK